mmetsp:Transcript_30749/g.71845  ORF Transcript_30749/g.71845 Transcript_30749/m.71845 type:complete len:245 (+) Transcript_30749:171-905(+)
MYHNICFYLRKSNKFRGLRARQARCGFARWRSAARLPQRLCCPQVGAGSAPSSSACRRNSPRTWDWCPCPSTAMPNPSCSSWLMGVLAAGRAAKTTPSAEAGSSAASAAAASELAVAPVRSRVMSAVASARRRAAPLPWEKAAPADLQVACVREPPPAQPPEAPRRRRRSTQASGGANSRPHRGWAQQARLGARTVSAVPFHPRSSTCRAHQSRCHTLAASHLVRSFRALGSASRSGPSSASQP